MSLLGSFLGVDLARIEAASGSGDDAIRTAWKQAMRQAFKEERFLRIADYRIEWALKTPRDRLEK